MNKIDLKQYGLTHDIKQRALEYDGLQIARVTRQNRRFYEIICKNGEISASVSGRFSYYAKQNADFPVVGDWVMIDNNASGSAIIHNVLERKSVFKRISAGTSHEIQIIASNIDIIFICMSLNKDFNPRRLERYLSAAFSGAVTPVIILTKADLCKDTESKLKEIVSVSAGADIIVYSSVTLQGYDNVLKHITQGKTIAFAGSSGVGKSTLINNLLGSDILATKQIRSSDDKGVHTTTYRQMLLLPNGGIVIDTPGMRELQLESPDLSKSFEDIEALALMCKFTDCSHNTEPGCAVKQAIQSGELSEKRFENYKKLQKETSFASLDSRSIENEKIKRMFGSKAQMKQALKRAKNKNKY